MKKTIIKIRFYFLILAFKLIKNKEKFFNFFSNAPESYKNFWVESAKKIKIENYKIQHINCIQTVKNKKIYSFLVSFNIVHNFNAKEVTVEVRYVDFLKVFILAFFSEIENKSNNKKV